MKHIVKILLLCGLVLGMRVYSEQLPFDYSGVVTSNSVQLTSNKVYTFDEVIAIVKSVKPAAQGIKADFDNVKQSGGLKYVKAAKFIAVLLGALAFLSALAIAVLNIFRVAYGKITGNETKKIDKIVEFLEKDFLPLIMKVLGSTFMKMLRIRK